MLLRCSSLTLLVLLVGCSGNRGDVTVSGSGTTAAASLSPEQLATGLNDLTNRIRVRLGSTADRIDDGAHNDIRRRTLRFRMRTSEVTWRAAHNPNHLAGLIELWFWMAAIDGYAHTDAMAEAMGEKAPLAREMASQLLADVEGFARQALPAKGFESIKARITQAAANGEVLNASPQREQAIIGDLLEVTKLQGVLGLALSPFEALRGIGTGADAASSLVVTADRAVDLLERYPEIIAWNLRLAVIDMEEQDTAREARAALQRSLKLAEELPARLRGEVTALLESTGPAQQQAQATLRDVTAAAQALSALNGGLQQTLAAIERMWPPADPAKPAQPEQPGRPFDIREYTAAIQAAEATLREARSAIETAGEKGVPAAEAAAARFEAAADRVIWRIGALAAFAAALAAALLVLHHRLKRRP